MPKSEPADRVGEVLVEPGAEAEGRRWALRVEVGDLDVEQQEEEHPGAGEGGRGRARQAGDEPVVLRAGAASPRRAARPRTAR